MAPVANRRPFWWLAVQIVLLCIAPLTAVTVQARETAGTKGLQNEVVKSSAPQKKRRAKAPKVKAHKGLTGTASFYANRFHGRKTASGHLYFKEAMTAAHRSLPLGTWVRVVNQRNGYYVVVQITDRGPYVGNRVIDLSRAAAENLDMVEAGLTPVSLEVVQEYPPRVPEIPQLSELPEFPVPAWTPGPYDAMRLASGY